jgi:hypothetical protein
LAINPGEHGGFSLFNKLLFIGLPGILLILLGKGIFTVVQTYCDGLLDDREKETTGKPATESNPAEKKKR